MRSRPRGIITIAVLAVVLVTLARPAPATAATPSVSTGRALRYLTVDFPDPFVLSADGRYYAYSTNSGTAHVPTMVSNDLVHWRVLADAVPELPAWARSSNLTWAPSVLRVGGRLLMYLSVWDHQRGRHCIAVATADHPAGPFTLGSKPLVCGVGAIDASTFRDAGGSAWLTWKFEAASGRPTRIVSKRLSADGTHLVGTTSVLISPTQSWEHGVVEGPSMIYRNGVYLLFYSASDWASDNYVTSVAVCASPQGSCVKAHKPLLTSKSSRVSPGGLSAFRAGGKLYVAYHVWRGGVGYPRGRRALVIAEVDFDQGVLRVRSMR